LFDSNDVDVLNVILSVDKDLLQTCRFKNTIQCITSFKPNQNKVKGGFQIQFDIFDDSNAVCYLNRKLKRGILTAEFVPMILAIAGDKADNICGLNKIGPVRASELIINYSIPSKIYSLKNNIMNMPQIIRENYNLIEKNYKMISFEEQIKRIPKHIL
jgi:5'-3' exonuclease